MPGTVALTPCSALKNKSYCKCNTFSSKLYSVCGDAKGFVCGLSDPGGRWEIHVALAEVYAVCGEICSAGKLFISDLGE